MKDSKTKENDDVAEDVNQIKEFLRATATTDNAVKENASLKTSQPLKNTDEGWIDFTPTFPYVIMECGKGAHSLTLG